MDTEAGHCQAAHPRLFAAREASLAALDELPHASWRGALTNSQGRLESRLSGVLQWLRAFNAGCLPDRPVLCWPVPSLASALMEACRNLSLPDFCRRDVALSNVLVQSLLFHLDWLVDHLDRGLEPCEAEAMVVQAFHDDWSERTGLLREWIEVFGEPGDLLKEARWDQLRGLLAGSDWQEVLRIRRVLDRMPDLVRLLRRLGRRYLVDDPGRPDAGRSGSMQRNACMREQPCEVVVPELPGATRGVHRSGRVARMLPAEAVLLGHPRLRLVWHARHAERTLLCYEDDSRLREPRKRSAPHWQSSPAPVQRMVTGPILVCVDTSGSMQGAAEPVAKAIVLEALRTAHAGGRACHLFAFGGPDEILELEPAVDLPGAEALAAFFGRGFHGGTDICGPLDRAIGMLERANWRNADLVIASDGQFGATPEVVRRVRAAQEASGLRVQGILIGDRETIGMLELCDDIYWVRDWRRIGGHDQDVPIHSQSLTAEYFPGALRSATNQAGTVPGDTASVALRTGWRANERISQKREGGDTR